MLSIYSIKWKSFTLVTIRTSVLAATVFLVVFTLALRLGALSPMSSSECSVLVSDWSELCWDDVSSARDAAASERAARGKNRDGGHSLIHSFLHSVSHSKGQCFHETHWKMKRQEWWRGRLMDWDSRGRTSSRWATDTRKWVDSSSNCSLYYPLVVTSHDRVGRCRFWSSAQTTQQRKLPVQLFSLLQTEKHFVIKSISTNSFFSQVNRNCSQLLHRCTQCKSWTM